MFDMSASFSRKVAELMIFPKDSAQQKKKKFNLVNFLYNKIPIIRIFLNGHLKLLLQ